MTSPALSAAREAREYATQLVDDNGRIKLRAYRVLPSREAEMWNTLAAHIEQLAGESERLRNLVSRASEELRMIEMKDCGAIYDVGLRSALRQAALTATTPSGESET